MSNTRNITFRSLLQQFRRNRAGGVAILFALGFPVVFGIVGGAIDYSTISHQRAKVQSVADSTALSVAREMTLTAMTPTQVAANVQRYAAEVGGTLGLATYIANGSVTADGFGVKVRVTSQIVTQFGLIEAVSGVTEISSEAIARLGQQSKLCLLALDELAVSTTNKAKRNAPTTGIELQNNSRLTANDCIVHSNSGAVDSVSLKTGARATVSLLCAVGGVRNDGGTLVGDSLGSCPKIADPLEKRPIPLLASKVISKNEACTTAADYLDVNFDTAGPHNLTSRVFCGNVTISGNAQVLLAPGIYVFQGTLTVKGNASLIGTNIGLFFSRGGSKNQIAKFQFLENAQVDLTAPMSGEMQGILIWEELKGAKDEAKIAGANYHQINTTRAKRLTGTIYLPAGHLLIDAPVQIAEQSDYTVLVVSRLDLADGPNLVLNSNYAGSNIPVPKGLGTIGTRNIRLADR